MAVIAARAVQDLPDQAVNVTWVSVIPPLAKMVVYVPKLLVLHTVSAALVQLDLWAIAVKWTWMIVPVATLA